jgi:hypothetical protein
MRKFLLLIMSLFVIAAPLAVTGSASADDYIIDTTTSTAPTTSAANVGRGHTIRVAVNAHGSKVLARTSTLWQSGHRVYDWSPKPGLYKVKSVIRYQIKTTTEKEVWVPDADCAEFSYDDFDGCAEDVYGNWDYRVVDTFGAAKSVTRYSYARVHADETPGCVSRAEWGAARAGMGMTRVHTMFGTSGSHYMGSTYNSHRDEWREYNACAGFGGDLMMNFDNYSHGSGMHLYSKSRSTSY